MDQFGKFQKISSWFDPENPLMDVRNNSERVTHINRHGAEKRLHYWRPWLMLRESRGGGNEDDGAQRHGS